ncbi:hypothetical protein ES703_34969 [subsurface metagenome]
MRSELTPLIVFATVVVATASLALVFPPSAASPIVVGHNTTIIADNGITTDNIVVNEDLTVGGGITTENLAVNENISMNAGKTVDGVDVSSHRHSGAAGDGPKLDGDNCLKDENLNLGTGGITSSKTIPCHQFIPSCEFGKPATNPPAVAIYGICQALEFSVDTDKAYYKMHVPCNWKPGTDILLHVHWTRSSTGSDDSTKTVKWQLKNLVINGTSENCQTGESTDVIQDAYDSSSTTDQIVNKTDDMTIAAAEVDSVGDIIILELMAVTPTGTALTEPAAVGLGITYTGYQVRPDS